MSEQNTRPAIGPPRKTSPLTTVGMWTVRYGIGIVMVLGGIVLLVTSPADTGADGFAMAVGGGLSVLMINFLYRLSVSSELDRRKEEEARAYFDEHGEWPEEEPTVTGRKWVLPAGVITAEDEEAALQPSKP